MMRRIYSFIDVKSSLISNMERANNMLAVNYLPIDNDRYCLAVVLKFPGNISWGRGMGEGEETERFRFTDQGLLF